MVTGPGEAFERRRGEIENTRAAGAQIFTVWGEIQCPDIGETSVSVSFPVFFVEKPIFSFGAELYPGQEVVVGQFPTADATVLVWHRRVRDDGSSVFVGAQIGMVTNGPSGQVTIVQWHVQGAGLRGPVDEDSDSDGV